MNNQNLTKLINHLETVRDEDFDMQCVYRDISGHIFRISELKNDDFSGKAYPTAFPEVSEFLSVTYAQAEELCMMIESRKHFSEISRKFAIEVLKNLQATGIVNWDLNQ